MSDTNILNLVQCCASEGKHILQTGIALSCGHHICQKCIPTNKNLQIKCTKCNTINQNNLDKCEESEIAKNLIESNLKLLFDSTQEDIRQEELQRESNLK